MGKKPRNSDGTIRRANRAKQLTQRSVIARWVEAETFHLKRLGMSYKAIADHIIEVAQAHRKAMVPVPADLRFPEDYRISVQAVHSAFRRGIVRLPNAEAGVLRKLDSERLEDMFLSLQAGIRKGDPKAVDAGVRILAHKARLNGYEAPRSVELDGQNGRPISISVIQEAVDALDDDKVKD
jgi:hypothetical protein